jgi:hypothetical protein
MLWRLARSLVEGHSRIQASRPLRAVLNGGRGVDMSGQGVGGRDRRLRRGWRLSSLTAELRGAAARGRGFRYLDLTPGIALRRSGGTTAYMATLVSHHAI